MGRRRYDEEFKREVLRFIETRGVSVAQAARDFDIHPNVIYKWKKAVEEDSECPFPGKGHLKPLDEEIRRLRRRLADVEEERDILKKVVSIFSKPQ